MYDVILQEKSKIVCLIIGTFVNRC